MPSLTQPRPRRQRLKQPRTRRHRSRLHSPVHSARLDAGRLFFPLEPPTLDQSQQKSRNAVYSGKPSLSRASSREIGLIEFCFKMTAMASAAQLASLRRAVGYNVLATAGAVLVAVFVVCAIFAPWIAPQDP